MAAAPVAIGKRPKMERESDVALVELMMDFASRPGRASQMPPYGATRSRTSTALEALSSLAVTILNEHTDDADNLCVVCGSAWPCELVVLAEHNYELAASWSCRPSGIGLVADPADISTLRNQ